MSIKFIKHNHITYLQWEELLSFGVKNCLTLTPYDFGISTSKNVSQLIELYNEAKIFAKCTSLETYFANQVHNNKVATITECNDSKDYILGRIFPNIDSLVTNLPNNTLITQYADCNPITLWDNKKKVLASVHSGWKGTSIRIIQKTLDVMYDKYNSSANDIHCFFWPSIGLHDFEVDEEVASIFIKEFSFLDKFSYKKLNKYYIDLVSINKKISLENGIPENQIYQSNISTYSDNRFHSFRRDKEKSGRMALITEI